MKIVFTGGITGGHFFPLIAVAQQIFEVSEERKLLEPTLYYFSNEPYKENLLYDNHIKYVRIGSGKIRRYASIQNIFDIFRSGIGFFKALFKLYSIFPDIIFSKGGGDAFPTLLAARLLGIPVFIHESDSVPGKANMWAGKFAYRVAVSFEEAGMYFKKEKVAYTGQPVRTEVLRPLHEGAHEYLDLKPDVPTLLILGGSQGSENINEMVFSVLPELVKSFQIIHQVGNKNIEDAKRRATLILKQNEHAFRYKPYGFLDDLATRMSAGVASIVISRAGSTIFEIASWNLPSIIIPITDSNGDHQRKNAFNYARAGACVVIEEANLTPHVFLSEIERLQSLPETRARMSEKAKAYFKPNAARAIAEEIVRIAEEHEK
ncbi:MAG: UDP-N-acetylglucosamine--N-acetylmuramyl-(pentapeptide) pyrophosphoryl-undecaprenol N-acetylglucosamine transferase [Minisyncoccia bacterium]